MEAMAAGLPVISTRVAGVPEMIEDGVTGRLLEEHDVPGMAEALDALLKNAALARQYGAAGRALVERRFASEITTGGLKHLLTRQASVWPPLGALRQDPRLVGDLLARLTRAP